MTGYIETYEIIIIVTQENYYSSQHEPERTESSKPDKKQCADTWTISSTYEFG